MNAAAPRVTAAALFVLLVLSCADAPAQDSLTLYGIVDAGLSYTSNQQGASKTEFLGGILNASRIGIKGAENLGGGTQALFTVELGFDPVKLNGAPLVNRQSFIGMADKTYGTLTAGRQYTPYCQLLCPLGPAAALTGATGAHPGDIDGLDTTIRISNAINYTSPQWSGAQVSAMYGFGETADGITPGSAHSAALRYDHGDWKFGFGYLKLNNSRAIGIWSANAAATFPASAINNGYLSAESIRFLAAVARYTHGSWMAGGSLSNTRYQPNGDSLFANTAVFNSVGLYSSWQWSPALQLAAGYGYTRASSANGIGDPAHYHQVSLSEFYSLSPRTVLYFLQAWQRAGGTTLARSGVPMAALASIAGSQNATPASGDRQSVFMFGLRTSF